MAEISKRDENSKLEALFKHVCASSHKRQHVFCTSSGRHLKLLNVEQLTAAAETGAKQLRGRLRRVVLEQFLLCSVKTLLSIPLLNPLSHQPVCVSGRS